MPRQVFSKALVAVVAVAGFSSLGILAYWHQSRVRSYQLSESVKLVPQAAIATTFVTPNPSALRKIEEFTTPETRAWIEQNLKPLTQQGVVATPLNYARDLQPWMGGVLVAVLPAPPGAPLSQSNLLMVIGIKDRLKAWQFSRRLQQRSDLKQRTSEYQGVKITEYQEDKQKRYFVSVLQNHLVIGANREAVEQAIDTARSDIPSLASLTAVEDGSTTFQQNVGVPNPIASIYIADYPEFVEQVSPETEESPLSSLSHLQSVQSLNAGLGVDQAGIRFKLVTQFDGTATPQAAPPELGKILARLPSDTLAFVNSQTIGQAWSQLTQQAENDLQLQELVDQIRQALQAIDLDADQEVFNWMDGEFALGAVASEEGVLAPLGLGGVLLLETSQRPQAEATLSKLDTIIAESNPPVNVEQRTLQGIKVTEWKDPRQGTLFGHGWLGDDLMFIAFGGPVVEAMTNKPQPSLQENARFQTMTQALPEANHSYVYVDMENLLAWATGYLLASPAAALQPNMVALLNSVDGLGVSATFPESDQMELEMFLALKGQ